MSEVRALTTSRSASELNPAQLAAVHHGAGLPAGQPAGPLLVIAGAGSGKTTTLAHRVAHLVLGGTHPGRILLLTFSRRAAHRMTTTAERIVSPCAKTARAQGTPRVPSGRLSWSGTFHAVANRLLRLHATDVGLDPSFTVLDRSDSTDLLDVERQRLGLASRERRFPQKATCLSIYSRVVNAQKPLETCLAQSFPWCAEWASELRQLFAAYVEAKQASHVLDYDDLLIGWLHLMELPGPAERVRSRFDHILVDEYQDTNALQAAIVLALRPSGVGLTVVGDDAQAIYGFRAATVRNILDFPTSFDPPATVLLLEQNYRSTEPILAAANAVIALAPERFPKNLCSTRASQQKPWLVTALDEAAQVDYVVTRVLEQREAGILLREQAVLFRAAHHSDALEVELGRRNIPFVKYGGLKFLESAHVKDVLCILRFAENPRDFVAAFRILQLLPGIGPAGAHRLLAELGERRHALRSLTELAPPPAAKAAWPGLCALLIGLASGEVPWPAQMGAIRAWYEPELERLHEHAMARRADLDALEQISASFPSRERFLSELALDPPQATGDFAGPPLLDEDFLVLSTIHSAKGQEWDAVFVLCVSDGCIPSDMATGSAAEIEEERRLLHVAMTRARDALHLICPERYYVHHQRPGGDRHLYAPRSRFIPDDLLPLFERTTHGLAHHASPTLTERLKSAWR